jgi:acyl carrier protein
LTYREFLSEFEQIVDAPAGSIGGQEGLGDLAGWDSVAMMMFVAMVDERLGLTLAAQDVHGAATVADLALLAGVAANRDAA